MGSTVNKQASQSQTWEGGEKGGLRTRIGGLRRQTELAHARQILACLRAPVTAICSCYWRIVELAIDKGT